MTRTEQSNLRTVRAWPAAALSGVLLGLSYPLGGVLALHVTAFLPVLSWLESRPSATARERARVGVLFAVVAHLISQSFEYAMLEFSWLAAVLYFGMLGVFALRYAAILALAGWIRHRTGLSWVWVLPMCWLPFEWFGTFTDLRLTIDHLAHTFTRYPTLIQFADVTGHYGVSAFLLAVNALLFEGSFRRGAARRRAWIGLAGLLAVAGVYDVWAWHRERPSAGTIRVAIVQPNIPLSVKHDAATDHEQWVALRDGTIEAARHDPDLIVWPESSRPWPVWHHVARPETYAMPEVQALARRAGAAILLGVEYARVEPGGDRAFFNAAMAVDPEGTLMTEWGAKVYLVPFTEGVPFRSLLGPLVEGRGGEWRWLAGGFTPGATGALVPVAGSRVGALVCFEQLFPDLARGLRRAGAEIEVVVTNDAWFGRSWMQRYLADAVRLRAIETRVEVVRAANTGISGFVDRRGVYHEETDLFEPAVIVRDVERSTERTIYSRVGDLVAWLAVAALVATSAGVVVAGRQTGRS
jgi:apolipoprotein N-acyltransferase